MVDSINELSKFVNETNAGKKVLLKLENNEIKCVTVIDTFSLEWFSQKLSIFFHRKDYDLSRIADKVRNLENLHKSPVDSKPIIDLLNKKISSHNTKHNDSLSCIVLQAAKVHGPDRQLWGLPQNFASLSQSELRKKLTAIPASSTVTVFCSFVNRADDNLIKEVWACLDKETQEAVLKKTSKYAPSLFEELYSCDAKRKILIEGFKGEQSALVQLVESDFFKACRDGGLETLKTYGALLSKESMQQLISKKNSDGLPALFGACTRALNNDAVVEYLLELYPRDNALLLSQLSDRDIIHDVFYHCRHAKSIQMLLERIPDGCEVFGRLDKYERMPLDAILENSGVDNAARGELIKKMSDAQLASYAKGPGLKNRFIKNKPELQEAIAKRLPDNDAQRWKESINKMQ